MGRPIKSKWFGDPDSAGYQLKITAKLPGEAVAEGFITEQTGTRKYKVNVNGTIGDVYLVDTLVGGDLVDGEGFMSATPFGGAPAPVYKLTQYRVSLHDGSGGFDTYTWSQDAAAVAGEADVLADTSVASVTATATATLLADVVDSIAVDVAGEGYTGVPAVTITDPTGTGATATATIAGGVVTAITVDTGGTGYTAPVVTIESPEVANA
jgi:hypothetical protein